MEAIRNAKLWFIRKGYGVTYFSFSRDLTVHTAALRAQILDGATTPQQVAKTIFERTLNFREAYTLHVYEGMPDGGVGARLSKSAVMPQTFQIDQAAIEQYKKLIASLPPEIKGEWEREIARELIKLGGAKYNVEIFGKIEKTVLFDLSSKVCSLLNQLGVQ